MNTHAIYYKKSLTDIFLSWIKKLWILLDKLEQWPTGVRFITFSISTVFGSWGSAFAAYMNNEFMLALVIFPSVITMAFFIAHVPVKLILFSGLLTVTISIITILSL